MNIAILAAGAGEMICGSCLRDNALARALRRMGHRVVLVPLYTPLHAEGESISLDRVFYGGINTYLQHASPIFRHTPRAIDWLLDRPALLRWAGSKGATTDPAKLADFTLAVLSGEAGPIAKELRRLVDFLKRDVRPQVVTLPNLMFLGAAQPIRRELGAAVVCELTGEDIFLEAMAPSDRARLQEAIRQRVGDVTRFVATSRYYARKMESYLGLQQGTIQVVHPGVHRRWLRPADTQAPASTPSERALTIGYLARMCPEKGLDRLIEAFALLSAKPGIECTRLIFAGYLSPGHRAWLEALLGRIDALGLRDRVCCRGQLDEQGKWATLDELDVLCVPTTYPEAKGIYVLEAWARAVPVVQPDHGSFSELLGMSGGGELVRPDDVQSLAEGLYSLLSDADRRRALGERGRSAVEAGFTEDHMASAMADVFVRCV